VTRESMKTKLLATTLLVGMSGGLWSSAAIAQDASDEPVVITEEEDAEALLERVQVTGSRIKRPDIDTVFPTTFIDTETLDKNAFTNIADALNQIPAFGGGVDPLGGQAAGQIGANFVDFFDLGVQRTLTLVNGRRFVSSDFTGNGLSVDFNVIPIALVDRIDTISVGGATIYGSDAIAGTINVILKDDYEGFEVTGQYGVTDRGDADEYQVQFVAGANTADGRGNVTFSAQYFNQQGLTNSDRPEINTTDPFNSEVPPNTPGFANIDVDGDGVPDSVFRQFNADGTEQSNVQVFTFGGTAFTPGPAGLPGILQTGFFPSAGFGTLGNTGSFFQFAPNGDLIPFEAGGAVPGASIFTARGGTPFAFFDSTTNLQTPLERIVFASTAHYDLTDNIRFFSDVQFANSQATQSASQGDLDAFQTNLFGGFAGPLEIPLTNPFLNAQALGVLTAAGLDPTAGTFLTSRFNADLVGAGQQVSESTVWRIAAGLEGDFEFAGRAFNWDIGGVAGESSNETELTPGIDNVRFLNAIEAVQLTQADLDAGASGAVGDIVCQVTRDFQTGVDPTTLRGFASGSGLSEDAPVDITDCVPLNLFGQNAFSQAAQDFVAFRRFQINDLEQSVFNANFGGELIELPGGTVGFNVGYETRRERASFLQGAGVELSSGRADPILDSGGSFTTNEFLGELFVPLVSPDNEIPFVYNLEAEGSVRRVRNNLAGNATIWTVGGSFSPVPDLTIRGNRTRSIRAPSLTELFAPQAPQGEFADDPCDTRFIGDDLDGQDGLRAANCASIGITQPFTSNVVNISVTGLAGGNPNLLNETSNAFTVGILAQPRWIPGLTVTADFVDINLDDAIGTQNLEANLESCFDSSDFPNAPTCALFERAADGQIVDFLSGQANSDTFNVQFVTAAADYGFDVADAINFTGLRNVTGDWGRLNLAMNLSRAIQRDSVLAGIPQDNTIGGVADPRWSGTNDFTYTNGGLRLFWRILWQDRDLFSPSGENFFALETETFDANGMLADPASLPQPQLDPSAGGRVLHNASIAYDLSESISGLENPLIVQLNVNNVLDRGATSLVRQAQGNFGFPEIFGRRFTIRLRAVF